MSIVVRKHSRTRLACGHRSVATNRAMQFGRVVACSLIIATASADDSLPRIAATSPDQATALIRLQNGFRAELIAAEPLVTDPIAIQYDEDGLLYVVEMNDYPYSDKSFDKSWQQQESAPLGRIRVLADDDGDGVYDSSTVFAENLSWPSGLALWKGGVYVTATPDVLYLKDTDDDGKADVRRKVFTGFRKYNVQAVMNNLKWGLDHHIYAAGSSNGGKVSNAESLTSVTLRRSDFRFDPGREEFELVAGGARFGHTSDNWGNRFLCNIRNPIQHVLFPSRYVKRNPFLPVTTSLNDVAASGDSIAVYQISSPEPWRIINAARQAADTVNNPPHDSTVPKGFVTSSSGVTIYGGSAYPREFQGNAFIGEVAGNLVMRYRIEPSGVSFAATKAHEDVEFLASMDNWFRPVNFANAPDGMLHVLDMYRETIEHPWSMPDDLKAQVDLTSGRDRGRIYRLVPPKFAAGFEPPPRPRMGSATVKELVAELSNPNSWWRNTAHRLIFERQESATVPHLRSLLRNGATAVGRLHALWSLEGLDALTADDVLAALNDSDEHLREHAVRLAESLLQNKPDLLAAVLKLTSDEATRVRFQVALTLGEVSDLRVAAALADIAKRDAGEVWMRLAVLSSLAKSELTFLKQVVGDADFVRNPDGQEMIEQLAFVIGAGKNQQQISELHDLVEELTEPDETTLPKKILSGLGAGLKRGGRSLEDSAVDSGSAAAQHIDVFVSRASTQAADSALDVETRLDALAFLQWAEYSTASPVCTPLLDSRQPLSVQLAALETLTSFPDTEVAETILERYSTLTPDIRSKAITRLLTRSNWLLPAFEAIAAGKVSKARIARHRREIYMKYPTEQIRQQAIALFGTDRPGPRAEVVDRYQAALKLPSDSARGVAVVKRECLDCHRHQNEGHEVGPNLVTVQRRTKRELLLHILDPNREVSPNFIEYTILTNSGRVFSGLIASETATTVTLRQSQRKDYTVLRNDIDEIQSQQRSLMPEGMEKKLSLQDMADLLAWLTDA
ncbi:MAG: c-type cytochrome [Fuerstiella sp.]|nr:c-type cytochrome [Fuerstiella sp.]MCP4856840.1 c-type cytochrome [Fuerstiella sp.]